MSNRARLVGVAASVGALALLSGCWNGGLIASAPESSAAPTTPAESTGDFAAYFDQEVEWSSCEGGEFECTTIVAPMDWENPDDTREVELAVVKRPSSGDGRLGTLFTNPGGPGASGYDFVLDGYDSIFPEVVRDAYDLVGWDPRGVSRSEPVTCYTDPDDIEEFLYFVPTVDPDTDPEGWVAEQEAEAAAYAEACYEGTGEVLEFVDTLTAVRDLELLRATVGDDVLNYVGYSYGTALGAIYVDEYPDRVGRVVLDGVVDRESTLAELNVSQMGGFELALTNFVTACPDSFDDCPFTTDVEASLARIKATIDAFNDAPVANAEGRVMTGTALRTAILMGLYSESYWESMSTMFSEVLQATPVTDMAWRFADFYNDFTLGVGYSSNLQDALWAVYCVDYPVETDMTALEQQAQEVLEAAPTLALDTPVMVDAVCSAWPYEYRGGQHGELTGTGAAPVLIVSTTGDPATPYEEGVKLADDLESGVLLSFDGEGHTAYSAYGDQCVMDTVDAYLVDGIVPPDDSWCP